MLVVSVLLLLAAPPPSGGCTTLLTDGCLDGFAVVGGVLLLLPRGAPPVDEVAMVAI